MPFVSGLELGVLSLNEVGKAAQSIFTLIEGPKHENQVTLRGVTLVRGHIHRHDIEVITPFIQHINRAVREGNRTLRLVESEGVDFLTELKTKEAGISFTGSIYPDSFSPQRQWVGELYVGNQFPIAFMSYRALHEGIAAATAVLIGLGIAVVGGLAGWWLHSHYQLEEEQDQHRHEEAMKALKKCVHYETDASTTVKGHGSGSGKAPASGGGEYKHSSGIEVHAKKELKSD